MLQTYSVKVAGTYIRNIYNRHKRWKKRGPISLRDYFF